MPERVCAVEGCGERARARGWCGTHYRRWREKGDPGPAEKRRYRTAGCSVAGCDQPHFVNGMCRPHDRAVKAHGTPTPRRRGEVVDGKRICPRCEEDKPLDEWGAASCCKACNIANARKYYTPTLRTPTQCAACGADFLATKRRSTTCSPECGAAYKKVADSQRQKASPEKARAANERWRRANLHKMVEKEQRRRARKRNSFIGPIDSNALWTGECGICGEAMNVDLKHPDPMSKSLDHIIPLARGGSHSQGNLQWAHLICNVRKGARVAEEVA